MIPPTTYWETCPDKVCGIGSNRDERSTKLLIARISAEKETGWGQGVLLPLFLKVNYFMVYFILPVLYGLLIFSAYKLSK